MLFQKLIRGKIVGKKACKGYFCWWKSGSRFEQATNVDSTQWYESSCIIRFSLKIQILNSVSFICTMPTRMDRDSYCKKHKSGISGHANHDSRIICNGCKSPTYSCPITLFQPPHPRGVLSWHNTVAISSFNLCYNLGLI